MNRVGENVVRIEAQALSDLADRIAGPMADAFSLTVKSSSRQRLARRWRPAWRWSIRSWRSARIFRSPRI